LENRLDIEKKKKKFSAISGLGGVGGGMARQFGPAWDVFVGPAGFCVPLGEAVDATTDV